MAHPEPVSMTCEEFFVWQEQQEERYELVDGVPVPMHGMTGASNFHDAIVINAITAFRNRLRGTRCRPATADTAFRVSIKGLRRPDMTIDCAPPDPKSYESREPRLVLEVLSPSTRTRDQLRKLEEYKRHPTLRHVLLVEPDRPEGTLYSRLEGGEWAPEDLRGPDAVLALDALGLSVPLGELYEDVPLDPA